MVTVKVPKNGTVLRRLLVSSIAKMPSTLRSTSKATLFHAKMKMMLSQQLIIMDSLLLPKLTLTLHGGRMAMAKALKNGMQPKRLLDLLPAKKTSTSK
jgi:hypothetical protein